MKRKKLFCCGILLALCLGIHGWAAPSDLLLQEGEMDFDQVYELLTALTPEELLADMERAYEVVADSPHGEEEDVLTPWTAAMIDRLDEFSDEDLLSIILDKSRSAAFRAAVIQLREMQTGGEETDERLYQMLLDEQEEEYLRTTLLLHLEFSTPSQQQLLQQLAQQDGDLGEYAEKKLEWSSREENYEQTSRPQEEEATETQDSASAEPVSPEQEEERQVCWTILLFSLSFLVGAGVWRQLGGGLFPPEQPEQEE